MEFNRVTDLYSDPDKNGEQVLIKRNLLLKVELDLDDINRIEEVVGSNDKPHKTKCMIYWGKQDQPILINMNYQKLKEIKEQSKNQMDVIKFNVYKNHKNNIGFQYKNKK